MGERGKKVEISKIQDLLGRLATDDKFRDEFAKNPARILGQHGIEVPEETTAQLPPKEVLAEAISTLVGSIIYVPWRPIWWPYNPWIFFSPFRPYWPWGPVPEPWSYRQGFDPMMGSKAGQQRER
jgi:putative modified peptide